jgi:hypothetical protein
MCSRVELSSEVADGFDRVKKGEKRAGVCKSRHAKTIAHFL